MTKEELQTRIEKKQKDIEKINKRIAKWSKGLRPEDIEVCKAFENTYYGEKPRNLHWSEYHGTVEHQTAYKNYHDYLEAHKNDIPSSDDWNKGPNIGELYSAYRDLGEARHTLEKYIVELDKLNNFDKAEKIQVIWDFLQSWREAADEYYHEQAQQYFELKEGHAQAWEKYQNSEEYKQAVDRLKSYNYSDWRIKYDLEQRFDKNYYADIDTLTKNLYRPHGRIDEEKLAKILDKEVQKRYNSLVNEVTAITGEITDASGLKMGAKGDINGIVVGEKGKAKVQTFGAGGHSIQRFHYRTRVDPYRY